MNLKDFLFFFSLQKSKIKYTHTSLLDRYSKKFQIKNKNMITMGNIFLSYFCFAQLCDILYVAGNWAWTWYPVKVPIWWIRIRCQSLNYITW